MNYGLGTVGSGISLMRILGGLSKTVGIVRQFAPIYRDIKPILKKAPDFFQRLNSLRNATYAMSNMNNRISRMDIEPATRTTENLSGPVFFQ